MKVNFNRVKESKNLVDVSVGMNYIMPDDIAPEEKEIYNDLFNKFSTITSLHNYAVRIGNLIGIVEKDDIQDVDEILNKLKEIDKTITIDCLNFIYNRIIAQEEASATGIISTIRDYTLQGFEIVEKYENQPDQPAAETTAEVVEESTEQSETEKTE